MENKRIAVTGRMVDIWLDMAEMMLACGAEIYRIEDTVNRIGRAYGADRLEVFVITSLIMVNAEQDGQQFTGTRRLRSPAGSNFAQLEDLNALARRVCREPMDEDTLAAALHSIKAQKRSVLLLMLANALAASSFTLFFGGSLQDAGFSLLFGLMVCMLNRVGEKYSVNRFSQYFISSVFTGVLICLLSRLIPVLRPDKIIVGVIMLTIPGIATTNSIRDMLTGDTISGTLRLIQSLLESLVLAASFMFAVWLTRANVMYQHTSDGLYQILPAMGGSLAFAAMFNCRMKYCLIAIPGGAVIWGVYLAAEFLLGLDVFACTLIATLLSGVAAEICARLFKAPATLFLIPFIVPLIPGSSLFYAFSYIIEQTTASFGMNCIMAVLGIAAGTGIVASAMSLVFRNRR